MVSLLGLSSSILKVKPYKSFQTSPGVYKSFIESLITSLNISSSNGAFMISLNSNTIIPPLLNEIIWASTGFVALTSPVSITKVKFEACDNKLISALKV